MEIIKVNDVSYQYPGTGFKALDNINITVNEGEKIAIIGQNGAGKTTLVRHFNGLLKPQEGNVVVKNKNTKNNTTAQLARIIGYVFQNPADQLFKNTVREELEFGPQILGNSKEVIQKQVDKVATMVNLKNMLDKNPYDISLSDRKFISIASILSMDPDIIIYDEPTAGQSHDRLRLLEEIMDELDKKGKTQIIISHDMEFVARNFLRTVVLRKGEIILDGETKNILKETDLLKTTHVRPPYLIKLSQEFSLQPAYDVDDFVNKFEEKYLL